MKTLPRLIIRLLPVLLLSPVLLLFGGCEYYAEHERQLLEQEERHRLEAEQERLQMESQLAKNREDARRTQARLREHAETARSKGILPAVQCPSTGSFPLSVKDAACEIATSVHGDRDSGILIVQATQAVAITTMSQSPQARLALGGLLEMWRKSLGRRSATVMLYYGEMKIATARNRISGEPYVEFHG